MPGQSWQETLINANVDGAALTNTVTATSILHGTAKLQIPPNYFRIGKMIKINAWGRISTLNPTPGTLTLDIRMGPTSNIIVANGGAMTINTVAAKTNVPWTLEWVLTCRAVGITTAANLMHQGVWQSEAVIGSAVPTVGGNGSLLIPVATPAVGTGFDSTVSMIVDLFATWSVANAANSILVHQYTVVDMNPSY